MNITNTLFVEHFTQAARVAEARGFPALPRMPVVEPPAIVEIKSAAAVVPNEDGWWPWRGLMLIAAEAGGVTVDDILGRDQSARATRPRQVYCWIARRFTQKSYPQIGGFIGRDHSTVQSACRKIAKHVDSTPLHVTATPHEWARHLLELPGGVALHG